MRNWGLIIAILAGVAGYFAYTEIPLFAGTHVVVNRIVNTAQPMLIFAMLLVTFCRIDPRHIHVRPWHWRLLAIQAGAFVLLGLTLIAVPQLDYRVEIEGAMICMICPTATAAAVITKKLGGDITAVISYTILINITTAVLVPLMTPFVHPNPSMGIVNAMMQVSAKVFPLLLLPLVGALLLKRICPRVHASLSANQELSFYLWLVALSLAIAVTVRSIVHSTVPLSTELALVAISAACCLLQFYAGNRIGRRYGDAISAQQSLGQKNTVVAIWLGYTFFSPVTAVAGGFYSVWHNLVNQYQLYRQRHTAGHSHGSKC